MACWISIRQARRPPWSISKKHFDEDVSLSRIYRYLDKLSDSQHNIVQDISVTHTKEILGGYIGVLFYDVTTLYFEADYEAEFKKRLPDGGV